MKSETANSLDCLILLLRDRRREQRISQIGACPVERPVRHFLQADPGANDGEAGDGVVDRQGPQGDPVRRSGRPRPSRPPAQEVVPDRVLRHLESDGTIGGLQLVHDDIPVCRRGMGRQIAGSTSPPHPLFYNRQRVRHQS